jgi:hypothetical protein
MGFLIREVLQQKKPDRCVRSWCHYKWRAAPVGQDSNLADDFESAGSEPFPKKEIGQLSVQWKAGESGLKAAVQSKNRVAKAYLQRTSFWLSPFFRFSCKELSARALQLARRTAGSLAGFPALPKR